MSKGFDTSLHYFAGAEDHWTQGSCVDQLCNAPDPEKQHRHTVDLWNTNQPAWGMNNTRYGGYLYNERVLETIDSHDPSQPLFFYIAFQQNHEPLEAPTEFIDRYSSSYNVDRRRYAAMTTFWDSSIGNITSALRRKNMFNDTLIVLSGDNVSLSIWSLYSNAPLPITYLHCLTGRACLLEPVRLPSWRRSK
jgi:arylsulfatase A-like enzyme